MFIAFEGLDGCGKSTQVKLLNEYILELDKYHNTVMTRAPYKNADIRKILQSTNSPYTQAKELAKLFTDDRRLQVKECILPNLKTGKFVITDRYSFSTLSYQQAQGIPLDELLKLHKGLPIPHIIFFVDTPVKETFKRMKKDKGNRKYDKHKFEKDAEFMKKLRNNFLELAKLPDHKVIIIDGTKSIKQIFEKQIKPAFDAFYQQRE